jgi:putative phage-type endonuclease
MDERVHRILTSSAPEQGTEEWLAWRRSKLTASDCAKIIGNAVKSRQRLIDEKRSANRTFSGNAYTEAGHVHEPHAIASYSALKKAVVHTNLKPVCHPLYPQLAASLDGVTDAGVNVEIKCLHSDKLLKKAKPVHTYQTLFQMACTGLTESHIVYYYLTLTQDHQKVDPSDVTTPRAMQVFEVQYDAAWFQEHLVKFMTFVADLQTYIFPFEIQELDYEYDIDAIIRAVEEGELCKEVCHEMHFDIDEIIATVFQ